RRVWSWCWLAWAGVGAGAAALLLWWSWVATDEVINNRCQTCGQEYLPTWWFRLGTACSATGVAWSSGLSGLAPGHARRSPKRPPQPTPALVICSVDWKSLMAAAAEQVVRPPNRRELAMLRWALIFLVVAILAAVFGFGGIAGDAAWIAKILLVIFLILAVISLIMGRKGPSTGL